MVVGVALAVTLFASLGTFFAASRARMTQQAARGVAVDWQVQLAPRADPARAERTIRTAPGVTAALPVGYADVPHFRASAAGAVQETGSGKALGIPPGYGTTFPGVIRPLIGATSGVLLAQQTAANLAATVGSTVAVERPGLPPARVRVDGVIDLPSADSLFQAVGAPPGAGPTAPPDNVILLPIAQWHRLFDPVTRVRPDAVATEVHVHLASDLPPDPGAAFTQVLERARNLEARLAGGGRVGDNLAAQLDAGRTDAVYAELLFLFLGLPGVVLAALITTVVAASGRDRRRRDQALLRVRGATPARIVRLAATEAAVVGVAGAAVGLAGAVMVGRALFGTSRFGATGGQAVVWTAVAVAAGLVLSFLALVVPAWRDARQLTVSGARAQVAEVRAPLWNRTYVDVLLLLAAGSLFWQAVRSGYQVVLAPEGVPTISVSYFTLLAPVCLWIGSALFAWRLVGGGLARGRPVLARATRPVAGRLSGVVAASMSRQRRLLSRGTVIVALAGAFALSTAVFDSTYQAQARVDAELTNGADVTATTTASTGLPSGLARQVATLPGVAAAEPMQHRFAYVGNDLQDLYGIDPGTIGRATTMSDAFFGGGSAARVLATLRSHPDGALVSDETVHDFQLQPGDLLRLRLQFASDHRYHVVPFHYVGIVREFPTAPRDSFIVANDAYVGDRTGSAAAQTLLVRTTGSQPAVASRIRQVLGPGSGATVTDIASETKITLSGLTAIDLSGLTRLELAYAIALAAAGSGLVLALGLAERRRTFAIASALGARPRQVAAFVWSEAAFVVTGGLLFGALAGWGVSFVVVKILTGVFDPPPEHLSWPWGYLAAVVGAVLVSVVVAGVAMVRATRRSAMTVIRDL
jgi:putative ABC transport system permease protein